MTPLPDDENRPCDLASLYVLGALSQKETQVFEAHLPMGCIACLEEIRIGRKITELMTGLPSPSPVPNLLQKLLSKAQAEKQQWEKTPFDGVSVKRLCVDSKKNTVSMLVEFAPRASYPRHRHADTEQFFILRGDLRVNGNTSYEGDFLARPAGSVDYEVVSETGCVCFAIASLADEIF